MKTSSSGSEKAVVFQLPMALRCELEELLRRAWDGEKVDGTAGPEILESDPTKKSMWGRQCRKQKRQLSEMRMPGSRVLQTYWRILSAAFQWRGVAWVVCLAHILP